MKQAFCGANIKNSEKPAGEVAKGRSCGGCPLNIFCLCRAWAFLNFFPAPEQKEPPRA